MSEANTRQAPVDLTQALAIRTKAGELRLFRTQVKLSIADGTLVKPYGMPVTLVTFEGYKVQAGQAGLQTIMAHTVVVDGQEQKNPHVVRDENHQALVVTCRAFTMGYTSMGIPVISDRTVIFDLQAYQAVDLLGKVDRCPAAFKLMDAAARPEKGWSAYPVDGVMAVHVNRATPEALDFVKNQMNRRRKAVEIAQTFAQRNSMKGHPAIRFHKLESGMEALVPILAWRPVQGQGYSWDMMAFGERIHLIEDVVAGKASPDTLAGGPVQVEAAPPEALHEGEGAAVVDQEAQDEADPVPKEQSGETEEGEKVHRMRDELQAMVVQGDKAMRKRVQDLVVKESGGAFTLESIGHLKPSQVVKIHLEVTKQS